MKKTIIKRITALMGLTAITSIGSFAAFQSINSSHDAQAPIVSHAQNVPPLKAIKKQPKTIVPLAQPQVMPAPAAQANIVKTPENIWMTYTIGDFYGSSGTSVALTATEKLKAYKIYLDRLRYIVKKTGPANTILEPLLTTENIALLQSNMAAKYMQSLNFTGMSSNLFDKPEVNKKFNDTINGIDIVDHTKTILVRKPANIFDPVKANESTSHPNSASALGPMTLNTPSEYIYKVASVDLKNVAQDKSILFDFKNTHITSGTATDDVSWTTMVLKNSSDFDPFKTGAEMTLKQMIASKLLYFRKTEVPKNKANPTDAYDPNHPNTKATLPKNVILKKVGGRLNVYIKANANYETLFRINHDLSADNQGAIEYGILDHSWSPLHVRNTFADVLLSTAGVLDTAKPILDTTAFTDNYIKSTIVPSHFRTSKFGTPSAKVNELSFYIKSGETFTSKIFFKELGEAAFVGKANTLTITSQLDTTTTSQIGVNVAPQSFTIESKLPGTTKFDAGDGHDIVVETEKPGAQIIMPGRTGGKTVAWHHVSIKLRKGVTSLGAPGSVTKAQLPYTLKEVDANYFFEDEGKLSNPAAHKETKITVSAFVDTSGDEKTIMETLYRNWWFPKPTGNNPDDFKPADFGLGATVDERKYQFTVDTYKEVTDAANRKYLVAAPAETRMLTPHNGLIWLNEVTNKYSDWAQSILKASGDPSIRPTDYYKMDNENTPKFQKQFYDSLTGAVKDPLDKFTRIANRLLKRIPLTSAETTDENDAFYEHFKGLKTVYNHKGNLPPTDKEWSTAPGFITAPAGTGPNLVPLTQAQYTEMFLYIEPIMVKGIQEKFMIEKKIFDLIKSTKISEAMKTFMTNQKGGVGVNPDVVKRVTMNVLSKPMTFISIKSGVQFVIHVGSGKEQIASLTEFISNSGLEAKYLEPGNVKTFKRMMGTLDATDHEIPYHRNKNKFLDESIWMNIGLHKSQAQQQIKLLDDIIAHMTLTINSKYTSISKIVDGIIALEPNMATTKGAPELANLLSAMVRSLSSSSGVVHYTFFNKSFSASNIQSAVVGHNLLQIIERYKKEHKKLPKEEQRALDNVKPYNANDPKIVTPIAVINGFHNINYFLDHLSRESGIKEIAEVLLGSRLGQSLTIDIPKSNPIIDLLSNSNKTSKYGFIVAGFLLTIVGLIATIVTFKASKDQGTLKQITVAKVLFVVILVIGIGLLGMGLIVSGTAEEAVTTTSSLVTGIMRI